MEYAQIVRESAAQRRLQGLQRWEPARPWRKGYPTHRRRVVRVRTWHRPGGDHRKSCVPGEWDLRQLVVGERRDEGRRCASSSSGVYRTRIRALIAAVAGTGLRVSSVLRLQMRDLPNFNLPGFLWDPIVQWLALRHGRGLRDGLVFCALHRPSLGLPVHYDDLRRRFLRHQARALGGVVFTLTGIREMHRGLMYWRRTVSLTRHLLRNVRRCEARKDLLHYLLDPLERPAVSTGI
jgi:hypothetical protein